VTAFFILQNKNQRGSMKSANAAAYAIPKPQVPRTQNQALHEEAIALILQTKQKRSEASVFEKAKQTREEYNKRRTEATDKLRTVLTKIWEAFDCGESVGIFATRKAWCKDQKVTMRWCQKVIAGPQSKKANTHESVRVDVGQQVIFRDGIYTVGLDGDGKAAFIPVALHVPIVHVNDDQPYDLYIGRKHNRNGKSIPASIWGNHDRLPLHEFEKQVRSNPELMAKLPELKGKVLGCWHRIEDYSDCHGSVLLKLVAELGDDQPTPIPAVKSYADGAVTVQTNFYNEEEVKALFDGCAKVNFVRRKYRGKESRHAVRIFCNISDERIRRKDALSLLSEAPDAVKKLVADLSTHSGKNVNYAAVVEYRDGDDYIAPHQHDEDRGNDATVWIVSTGAERPFVVKPVNGDAATKFLATQGSLITLSSESNETHLHSVPKCKGCTGVRYSVNCKALPISISGSEVPETIPSSPGWNDASSTSVASPARSSPQKDAQTVKSNYEHIPSFLTKQEAAELYDMILKQEWTINDDGRANLIYGVSYDRGGPISTEIPVIPDFLRRLADRVSEKTQCPVNFVQVHRFEPEHPVLPHYDPRGMCVPMITVGQERTFQVGDDGNSKSPSGKQRNRKVDDHSPETRILMRHGDLLVFIGNKVLHSMYPASKDGQFNPNGYDYRISILFRYTTGAMREFGVGVCNRHGHEKQYRKAVNEFRARQDRIDPNLSPVRIQHSLDPRTQY
jgi:alkylated DNA repair dioxygenase AlkB